LARTKWQWHTALRPSPLNEEALSAATADGDPYLKPIRSAEFGTFRGVSGNHLVMAVESDEADLADSLADPARFTPIFDRHFDEIYRFVAFRLGPSMAEDLAADTFLQAFRSRHRFDGDRGTVRAWLYGIASNAVRHHRRTERRQMLAYSKASRFQIDVGDESSKVDGRIDAATEARRVLARLEPKARDVVLLVGAAGLTYAEAASVLGIPVGTVRSRYSRARDQLQKVSSILKASSEQRGGSSD